MCLVHLCLHHLLPHYSVAVLFSRWFSWSWGGCCGHVHLNVPLGKKQRIIDGATYSNWLKKQNYMGKYGFIFTFVMILSHSPLNSSTGLVNVRGVVLLAEMVVEAASPPVLLLISLHRLDCGWAEYSSPCTFSKQVGCLVLRMLAGLGRHDSFQDQVR